jgi:hypothetical protein
MLRLDTDTHRKLKIMAAQKDTTMTAILRRSLRRYYRDLFEGGDA